MCLEFYVRLKKISGQKRSEKNEMKPYYLRGETFRYSLVPNR